MVATAAAMGAPGAPSATRRTAMGATAATAAAYLRLSRGATVAMGAAAAAGAPFADMAPTGAAAELSSLDRLPILTSKGAGCGGSSARMRATIPKMAGGRSWNTYTRRYNINTYTNGVIILTHQTY